MEVVMNTHNERVVMRLELVQPAIGRVVRHRETECPLVDDGEADILVFLEERGGDEWFEDEPAAEVDAIIRDNVSVISARKRRGVEQGRPERDTEPRAYALF